MVLIEFLQKIDSVCVGELINKRGAGRRHGCFRQVAPRVGPGTPFPLVPSLPRLLLFFTFPLSQWL